MINRILFILLMLVLTYGFPFATSQAQEWSPEIVVSDGTTPDLDIDPVTGHLHIITMIDRVGVRYIEMDNSGNIIGTPEIVPGSEEDLGGANYGASISVSPDGKPYVCYRIPGNFPKFSVRYTYKTASGWATAINLGDNIYRGWIVQIDVDKNGVSHIARGSATGDDPEPMVGPVTYYNFLNSQLRHKKEDITKYRCDDRVEIDASYQNQVHLILGCPDYPKEGGPVWYWRSKDSGTNWESMEIHSVNAKGANRAPDLFVDASGNTHIVYGSELDQERGKQASVRYARFTSWSGPSDGTEVRDLPITDTGEIIWRYDTPEGMASVAATPDGQTVIVAYSENWDSRLFVRRSNDGGATWSERFEIAPASVNSLGRNKQFIRAYKDNFYVVYPTTSGPVKMRYLKLNPNHTPVAHAGGPYTGNEGTAINFNASQSTDQDNNIKQYDWDFQSDGVWDGSTTTPTTSFTYWDNFSGQVKVCVVDDENEGHTATANVTIANVAPTAEAGGPYSAAQGGTIQFHGSAQDPGSDVLTYKWDLNNDGVYETTGQNPQKTFSTGGQFTVWLEVTDDDGGSGKDSAPVVIAAYPPVLQTIANQTIAEGGQFTPIDLAAAVSDADHADNQITWTFLNAVHLRVTQTNLQATIAPIDPEWNGNEQIGFIATDPTQLADTTFVTFTITAVNDAPRVSAITVAAIDEGSAFNPISLDTYVSDPDNPTSEITWSATGQNALSIQISARQAIITIPNPDWFGSENINFIATDKWGLSGQTTTAFTVRAVNDPPVIVRNPGQSIQNNQTFKSVLLDTIVTDVDNADNTLQWSFSGADQLQFSISNRILSITKPSANWFGTDDILLTASDGQLSAQVTAVFSAVFNNQPPVISGLTGETISENGHFQSILLDSKVSDASDADDQLTWTVQGNVNLLVSGLAQRQANIAVADSEWAGSETLTFSVSDPGGMRASASATFTVLAVNDRPQISFLPDISFDEDTTYVLTKNLLQSYVRDADHSFSQLQFSLTQNLHVRAALQAQTGNLVFSADQDWYGSETAQFTVTDPQAATAMKSIKITVNSRPDPPAAFALSEPKNGTFYETKPASILFTWERAEDSDANDFVRYAWKLSRQNTFENLVAQVDVIDPNTTWSVPIDAKPGWYFWKVTAIDLAGNQRDCNDQGVFVLEKFVGVEDAETGSLPDQFALLPNFPNPFNPETTITYQLPKTAQVSLAVYNELGQLIQNLVDSHLPAGVYSVTWNGKKSNGEPAASGTYLLKMQAGDFQMTRKMLLVQ